MSTGGSPSGNVIASAVVQIGADETEFDAVTKALPRKVQEQFQRVTSNIAAAMAKNNAAIAAAQARMSGASGANGNMAQYRAAQQEVVKLSSANSRLESDARRAAQAMLNMGRSAQLGAIQARNAMLQEAAALDQVYAATVRATAATQTKAARMNQGGNGGNGGRGGDAGYNLILISQFFDDAQYGLRALTNQIPQFTTAILSMFGVGSKAAMAFGGAIGIVAVVINQLIGPITSLMQNLDKLGSIVEKDSFFGKFIEGLKSIRGWIAGNIETTKAWGKELLKTLGYDMDKADIKNRIASGESIKSEVENNRDQTTKGLGEGGAAAIARVGGGKAALDILMQNVGKGASQETKDALRAQRADLLNKIANPGDGGASLDDIRKFLEIIKGTSLENLTNDLSPQAVERRKQEAEAALAEQRRIQDEESKQLEKHNSEAKAARDKSVDEAAESLGARIQRSMLRNPDSPQAREAERRNILDSLQKSGMSREDAINILPDVIRKIGEGLEKAISDRVLAEGATPEKARAEQLRDLDKQNKDDAERRLREGMDQLQKSQSFGSGSEFASQLIRSALDQVGEGKVAEATLKAVQDNTVQLEQIAENTKKMGRLQRARYED